MRDKHVATLMEVPAGGGGIVGMALVEGSGICQGIYTDGPGILF